MNANNLDYRNPSLNAYIYDTLPALENGGGWA